MTAMKGTFEFNSIQGGFTESLYSQDQNETYASMQQKMLRALNKRCKMSETIGNTGCNNPIIPVFIRVEDENIFRDAITIPAPATVPTYNSGTASTNTIGQNLDLELGARVQYIGGLAGQSAAITHHGLPVDAFPVTAGAVTSQYQYAKSFLRTLRPVGFWIALLADYVSQLCKDGLGFRQIAGAWNVANSPGPYSSPDSVFYNAAMQMIELQWVATGTTPNPPFFPAPLAAQAPPNWPAINSICKLQVRKWKGFQVLQGRWAAQVVTPQAGSTFALRILRLCRQPMTSNKPFVSPIAWSNWFPGQNLNPSTAGFGTSPPKTPLASAVAIAGSFAFVESKKLGRNFGEQRGRARNRPT